MVKDLINLNRIQNNLTDVRKEINNVFEKFNESVFGNYKRPSINISQNSSFINISAELPGLDKEDINLKLNHNSLEINGEKKKKMLKKNGEESTYKGYKATVGVPSHVDIDNIKAEFIGMFVYIPRPHSDNHTDKSPDRDAFDSWKEIYLLFSRN